MNDSRMVSFETKRDYWADTNSNLYDTNILLQDENGPCALIAIINTLILRDEVNNTKDYTEFKQLLQRPLVTLQELLEQLGDRLLKLSSTSQKDTTQVLNLLPSLHTGLNVNPEFLNGGFEEDTLELSIFRSFKLDLIHGWVANPLQDPEYEIIRNIGDYENSQKFLVETSDLIFSPSSELDEAQQATLQEHVSVKSWLARTATQLTPYGLNKISDKLESNSFAIFFRNDHFSTIYKRDNNDLYLLVTDNAFKSKNIVWQSLNSVKGDEDIFFSGDFTPVFNDELNLNIDDFEYNENELNDRQLAMILQQDEDEVTAKRLQKKLNTPVAPRPAAKTKEAKSKGDKKKRGCIIV